MGVLAAVCAVLGGCAKAPEGRRPSHLNAFIRSSSGGELGGYDSFEISDNGDGTAKVIIEEQLSWDSKVSKKKYSVPSESLYDIEQVMLKHDMLSWRDITEKPDEIIEILDAPVTSFRYVWDGEEVKIDFDVVLPDDSAEAMNEIRTIITKIENKEYK